MLREFSNTFSGHIKNFRINLNNYYLQCWTELLSSNFSNVKDLEKILGEYSAKAIFSKEKLYNRYKTWRKDNEDNFRSKMSSEDKEKFIRMGLRLHRLVNESLKTFYSGMINIAFLSLVRFCYSNYSFIPHDSKGLDFVLFVINESFEVAKVDKPKDVKEFIEMAIEEFEKRIYLFTLITDEDVIELGTKTGEYKNRFLKVVTSDKNLLNYIGYPICEK